MYFESALTKLEVMIILRQQAFLVLHLRSATGTKINYLKFYLIEKACAHTLLEPCQSYREME